jgi:hypothetical protein
MEDYELLVAVPDGHTICLKTRTYLLHNSWYTSCYRRYIGESRHDLLLWLQDVVEYTLSYKLDSERASKALLSLQNTYYKDNHYTAQLQLLVNKLENDDKTISISYESDTDTITDSELYDNFSLLVQTENIFKL